jgi:hypothetical protein
MDMRVTWIVVMSWVGCFGCVADSDEDPPADAESATDPDDGGASSTDPDDGATSATGDPTDEGGEVEPDACAAPADAMPSGFALDLGAWLIEDEFFSGSLQAACTITEVDVSTDVIVTALECMDGDAGPYIVTIDVAVAAGTPTWAVDDDVDLLAIVSNNQGGLSDDPDGGAALEFLHGGASLRRASDGALLVMGVSGALDPIDGLFAPLELELLGICGEVEGCSSDDDVPRQFTLRERDGDAILLTGGQHAELALADGTTLVIDAPRAHATSDCHFGSDYGIAARRMAE